jgi:transcriptional regulator with XRE-family HTH domain
MSVLLRKRVEARARFLEVPLSEIARRMGVTRQAMDYYLRGRPRSDTMERLAAALELRDAGPLLRAAPPEIPVELVVRRASMSATKALEHVITLQQAPHSRDLWLALSELESFLRPMAEAELR